MPLPPCPNCQSSYTYADRDLLICPECAHEWKLDESSQDDQPASVRDANGNPLFEGDQGTLIKDLKVKGSSNVLKVGTKVKINRIVDGDHNIDCRVDKVGEMMLKSEFVKKANN
ncbi:alkylphosphonate utilization protein [Saccharophagus degradans]|uniref:zinc ribbon domain-containing protein YjdM n=1 Tax=Saccharophagus degradans TaxID=86304 RepID=UPI001C083337|nr:zinc ribbon domain-containing protein YjdM [Saccharophagus degradans]MBU2984115.1 alkylphosphonate utilization protein [Saccharophagus degradans]WGO96802.1 zinc ribbon domain-containing protein YjdM [Saccharophagus degradans]